MTTKRSRKLQPCSGRLSSCLRFFAISRSPWRDVSARVDMFRSGGTVVTRAPVVDTQDAKQRLRVHLASRGAVKVGLSPHRNRRWKSASRSRSGQASAKGAVWPSMNPSMTSSSVGALVCAGIKASVNYGDTGAGKCQSPGRHPAACIPARARRPRRTGPISGRRRRSESTACWA